MVSRDSEEWGGVSHAMINDSFSSLSHSSLSLDTSMINPGRPTGGKSVMAKMIPSRLRYDTFTWSLVGRTQIKCHFVCVLPTRLQVKVS